jgi:YD repeat-containing protein
VSAIAYDGAGRRTSVTDGTGTSTWAWDALGRLDAHTDGAALTVDYGYDLNGNLTSLLYPGQATPVSRT